MRVVLLQVGRGTVGVTWLMQTWSLGGGMGRKGRTPPCHTSPTCHWEHRNSLAAGVKVEGLVPRVGRGSDS